MPSQIILLRYNRFYNTLEKEPQVDFLYKFHDLKEMKEDTNLVSSSLLGEKLSMLQ